MKRFALAALAATLTLAVAAPAIAEEGHREGRDVKKVIIHRDHDRHHGWREGRHEGRRDHHVSKIVIKHGHGRTVIKKREG